jgi:hypothetical protein
MISLFGAHGMTDFRVVVMFEMWEETEIKILQKTHADSSNPGDAYIAIGICWNWRYLT